MKTLFAGLFLLTLTMIVSAQETEQKKYIEYKGDGDVLLKDGTTLNGVVLFAPQFPGRIKIQVTGEDKERKINYNEMTRFTIGDKIFHIIQTSGLGNPNTIAQLLTPEEYEIKVYKYEQQSLLGTNYLYNTTTDYYVSVPGEEKAYSLTDMKLMPFNKKMAKYTASCKELSTKILKKNDGYKIPLISTMDQKIEIIKKIAKEYEECK